MLNARNLGIHAIVVGGLAARPAVKMLHLKDPQDPQEAISSYCFPIVQ